MNESEKAVHHNVYGLSHIRHDVLRAYPLGSPLERTIFERKGE
jgi:hypothetical protein